MSWEQLANMVTEQTQAKLNTITEYEAKLTQFEQFSVDQSGKFTQVRYHMCIQIS